MDIKGEVALVTGGASGLGAAVAEGLADRGARVAVLDLVQASGGEIALLCDVTSPDEVAKALARVQRDLGPPRILVNCAGIGTARRVIGRDGPMPLEAFERVIRVNLIGTFNVIRLVAEAMSTEDPTASGERGIIISTASVAAFEGQVGQAAYAASKGGIAAMTLPLAREFARFGIRVLTLAPGIFDTPLLDELPDEAREALAAAIPFPARLGRPEEYADLVAACIGNPYLNGDTIRIDGALRLNAR